MKNKLKIGQKVYYCTLEENHWIDWAECEIRRFYKNDLQVKVFHLNGYSTLFANRKDFVLTKKALKKRLQSYKRKIIKLAKKDYNETINNITKEINSIIKNIKISDNSNSLIL